MQWDHALFYARWFVCAPEGQPIGTLIRTRAQKKFDNPVLDDAAGGGVRHAAGVLNLRKADHNHRRREYRL
eukprot:scaffold181105_cov33-Tisochrysis_lutea.AAC.2